MLQDGHDFDVGEKVTFTLGTASEHVSVETVYVDTAFDSIGVMDVLEQTPVSFHPEIIG